MCQLAVARAMDRPQMGHSVNDERLSVTAAYLVMGGVCPAAVPLRFMPPGWAGMEPVQQMGKRVRGVQRRQSGIAAAAALGSAMLSQRLVVCCKPPLEA